MRQPSIIAVIPARAGSKRLPGKNVRPLAGKPLLAWTIETALGSGVLSDVLISTDSQQIADLAVHHGASFVGLRSPVLATDEAAVIDVLAEVLEVLAGRDVYPDAVMLLQPTSPFRAAETIRRAVARFVAAAGNSVVSVSPARTSPAWCRQINAAGCLEPLPGLEPSVSRKQELPDIYELNGLVYVASRHCILARRSLYTEDTVALLVTDPVEALDIDTAHDWAVAEAFAGRLLGAEQVRDS